MIIIPSGGGHGVEGCAKSFVGEYQKEHQVCGIAAEGKKVPENELNEHLKQLLVALENAEMVLNTEEAGAENIIEVESHNESEEDELGFIQNGASDIMEGLDADDNSDE